MATIIPPADSEWGKELIKWEQHRTKYVPDDAVPGNPYVFREYPKMLYKAHKHPSGQMRCLTPMPHPFEFGTNTDMFNQAILMAETFNNSCTRLVKNAAEEAIVKGQGWCLSIKEAIEWADRQEQDLARAAAEAAFHAQHMGERAQAEFKQAEGQTDQHVTDVVPKRKRGRPAKGVTAVSAHPVEG